MSEPDDRDMLAADYVLGTLDAAERAEVAGLLAHDPELARAVEAWENRLAPLVGCVPEVAPPRNAYAGIAARVFDAKPRGAQADPAVTVSALRRRLRRWQAGSAGLALLAASLAAWIAVREAAPAPPAAGFAAVLQRDAGAPAMLVEVDLATRRMTVRPLASPAPAGHAYQLWIIDPALGAPRSLGLVPADAPVQESLTRFEPGTIAGATYAVTVEPVGGSPTGRPSTPPLMTGKLSAIRS